MDTIPAGRRLTLHLGVIDQRYRARGKKVSTVTTGDVANWLEEKYGLFTAFYKAHSSDIADAMEVSLQGALEALMMGQKVDPFLSGMGKIEAQFKKFILTREAERVGIPGTPTMAAMRGVNHRLRHPYASSNPRRASFDDTGLMLASFKAWTD